MLVNGALANPTTKHFLINVMLNWRCKIIDKYSYMKLGVAEHLATFKSFNRFYLHLEKMCFYFVLSAAQLSMWNCNSSVHKLLLFKMKSVKWWWWYQDEKCEIIMIMIMMTITITTTTQQKHCSDGDIPPSWVLRDAWKSTTTNNFYPWPIQALGFCSALRRPSICLSVRPSCLVTNLQHTIF